MQRSRSSPCYGSESTACCHQGTRLRRDPPPHISCPHRGFSPSCTGPAEAPHVQGTPHCHAWRPLQRAKVTRFAAQPWHALATPSGDPTALQVRGAEAQRAREASAISNGCIAASPCSSSLSHGCVQVGHRWSASARPHCSDGVHLPRRWRQSPSAPVLRQALPRPQRHARGTACRRAVPQSHAGV